MPGRNVSGMDICRIDDCERPRRSKGLCVVHYSRWLKHGSTDKPQRRLIPMERRLWSHVRRGAPDECWPWTGKSLLDGYGYIGSGKRDGRSIKAHRAAWELVNGPIPKGEGFHGFVVMHLCDNRACCNPAHLRLGTQAENMRDMHEKGRNNGPYGETHKDAKLTEAAVREIRAANDWTRDKEFARKFGVGPRSIYDVRRGKVWKHVT